MRYYLHMKSAAKKSSRQVLLDMNRDGLANAAKGAVNQSHFGLVVWLADRPVWLALLALVFLGTGAVAVGRGKGTLDSLFRWLAFSLSLALLSSYHIEHYYYLVPLILALFHQITVLDPEVGGRRLEPAWSWETKKSKG